MPKKSGKSSTKAPPAKTASKETIAIRTAGTSLRTGAPRRLSLGQYKSLRLQKRIKHPVKLPNVWRLTKQAWAILWQHKRLFGGITVVYGLLNVVLAQGLSGGTDVTALKHALDQVGNGHFWFLVSGFSIFTTLVGSAGNTTSPTAGAYQLFFAIIASLAIIWGLRQVLTGARPYMRDAFYKGMYPLVPFLLVLAVISLQLVPLVIGATLYSTVINNGIAVYAIEKTLWLLLFLVLALLTLYMISSSLFALYIVTLPDMTPMKALRSARGIVRYRRWTVLRKILCLPLILLIIAAIIMLPIIILATPLARWVFFLLSMFSLVAIHAYLYTLYRELLNE